MRPTYPGSAKAFSRRTIPVKSSYSWFFRQERLVSKKEHDPEREDRIRMEAIVDCYTEEEEAMGWYYYLEDKLGFPFKARCIAKRAVSPLKIGDEVQVLGMAPEEECARGEMFVLIRHNRGKLAVPLVQLEPVDADPETVEAVGDWHYWA
jgi:hypothetical protein